MEIDMSQWKLLLIIAAMIAMPTVLLAQQLPRPASPGEVAKVSRILAEKNETCRLSGEGKEAEFLGPSPLCARLRQTVNALVEHFLLRPE
jgi:hypothetical protein